MDYWLNYPVTDREERISSQKWHRDYEDLNLLKMFIFLDDVNAGNGPFCFVERSQRGGTLGDLFKRTPPLGVEVEDAEIKKEIDAESIKTFEVPRGTVLFVDTSGIHRGGFCEHFCRFVYTSSYTTFGGISGRNYVLERSDLGARSLPLHVQAALTR